MNGLRPAAFLEVRGLTAAYRQGKGEPHLALQGVSLEVHAGEIVGLTGPNGSGKTTLIRAITRGITAYSGAVTICGKDQAELSQREIARRVAVVPQTPDLPEAFTALDAVLMGRTPYLGLLQSESADDLEAAQRAMLATDTWRFASRKLCELSGGERQRVVMARAIAQESPVLLLDEPTAHLDIGHQASTLDLVLSLTRSGSRAALVALHDLTLAAQYCDRLVMLEEGRVVAEGLPAEVLEPGLLTRLYGGALHVFPHPRTGRPVVAPGSSRS